MTQEQNYAIAIDGPAGAGKSTLAKALARELGLVYVDTGAIYRTVGYSALRCGVDVKNAEQVTAMLKDIKVDMKYHADGLQHMFLNGEDVTEQIRQPEVSLSASAVSAYPAVRAFLMEMQRDMARRHSVIMDGRDIGTVVLPHAEVKIYLTAAPEARARRRCLELEERGIPEPYEKVLQEIQTRDYDDSHRAVAPLRPAEDAVEVDTTDLTFEESKAVLLQLIEERIGR